MLHGDGEIFQLYHCLLFMVNKNRSDWFVCKQLLFKQPMVDKNTSKYVFIKKC